MLSSGGEEIAAISMVGIEGGKTLIVHRTLQEQICRGKSVMHVDELFRPLSTKARCAPWNEEP